eukprot:GHRR01011672.1.p1 GENE.GHRR01011672.1~~GHRR01011672.1.p1  ORF type:complete len:475 (+),score=141.48 GHRR01011672.1:1450-2874(+)
MYGYSFGAAKSGIWHIWKEDFMLYPSYTPHSIPYVMHYGLIYHVANWTFDKHFYFDFDAHKCTPWDLTKEKPKAGIFPPPPHPDKLSKKDFLARYRDLLSVSVITIVNAALCDYHVRNCPPSAQLAEVCNQAFKLHYDVDQELKNHEWDWQCVDHNLECRMWADRGECKNMPAYMGDHCRVSCNLCNPRGPRPKGPEDTVITVEDIMRDIGLDHTTAQAAATEAAKEAAQAAAGATGTMAPITNTNTQTKLADAAAELIQAAPQPPPPSPARTAATAPEPIAVSATTDAQQEAKVRVATGSGASQSDAYEKLKKYPASTLSYAALIKRCTQLSGLTDQQVKECVKAASLKLQYPSPFMPNAATAASSAGQTPATTAAGLQQQADSVQVDGADKLQAAVGNEGQDLATLHAAAYKHTRGQYENMLSRRMTGTERGWSFLEQTALVVVVVGLMWQSFRQVQKFRLARAQWKHSRKD